LLKVKYALVAKTLGLIAFRLVPFRKDYRIWIGDQDNQIKYVSNFKDRARTKRNLLQKIWMKAFFSALDSKGNARSIQKTLDKFSNVQSVTEIGAGYGRILKILEEDQENTGIRFLGLELSSYLIQSKICDTRIVKIDIVNDDTNKFKSDIVFCWAVLMYFSDREIEIAIRKLLLISRNVVIFELPQTQYRISKIIEKIDFNSSNEELNIWQQTIWSF
jgi:hypothetical protein